MADLRPTTAAASTPSTIRMVAMAVSATLALAVVAMGVRIGTSGFGGSGRERSPADAAGLAAAAVVDPQGLNVDAGADGAGVAGVVGASGVSRGAVTSPGLAPGGASGSSTATGSGSDGGTGGGSPPTTEPPPLIRLPDIRPPGGGGDGGGSPGPGPGPGGPGDGDESPVPVPLPDILRPLLDPFAATPSSTSSPVTVLSLVEHAVSALGL